MIEFMRICPRCGLANPERYVTCQQDGEFLGFEAVIPASPPTIGAAAVSALPTTLESSLPTIPRAEPINGTRPTERLDRSCQSIYLEVVGSSLVFTVRDGATVGQAHPSALAEVQIGNIPGVTYVHRRHCRIERRDFQWFCTAIDQREFGREFTNPTHVNKQPIMPGQSLPIRNGDCLTLATVNLIVRMP